MWKILFLLFFFLVSAYGQIREVPLGNIKDGKIIDTSSYPYGVAEFFGSRFLVKFNDRDGGVERLALVGASTIHSSLVYERENTIYVSLPGVTLSKYNPQTKSLDAMLISGTTRVSVLLTNGITIDGKLSQFGFLTFVPEGVLMPIDTTDDKGRRTIINCRLVKADGVKAEFVQLPLYSYYKPLYSVAHQTNGLYLARGFASLYLAQPGASLDVKGTDRMVLIEDNKFLEGPTLATWRPVKSASADVPIVLGAANGGLINRGMYWDGRWQTFFHEGKKFDDWPAGEIANVYGNFEGFAILGLNDNNQASPFPNGYATWEGRLYVTSQGFNNPKLVVKLGDQLPGGKVFDTYHYTYASVETCSAGFFTVEKSDPERKVTGWYRFAVPASANCLEASKTPQISAVANTASFTPAVAPSGLMTIKGRWLSKGLGRGDVQDALLCRAIGTPWNDRLCGVRVLVNGLPAKLFYAFTSMEGSTTGESTLIAQIPPTVPPGQATVQVETLDQSGTVVEAVSEIFKVVVEKSAPALFHDYNRPGWPIIAQNTSGELVSQVSEGDVVLLWGTGFGRTVPDVPDGYGAEKTGELAWVTERVTVIAQLDDESYWEMEMVPEWRNGALMSPQFPGIYQIAFRIPYGMPATKSLKLFVKVGDEKPSYAEPFTILVVAR